MGQSDIEIGHDLESCTDQVRTFSCLHPNGSDTVVFVDTPGFDDTNLKDTEILKAIADWLTATYRLFAPIPEIYFNFASLLATKSKLN